IITRAAAQAHVDFLASDELEGRDTPSRGLTVAGRYVASRFAEYGLKPGNKGKWFQDYGLSAVTPSKDSGLKLGGELISFSKENGVPFFFSAQGSAKGELVFAGYGITAENQNYDDYQGLDVKGKIVVVLRYAPNKNDRNSFFGTRAGRRHQTFTTKFANAIRHGAAGMLLVTGPAHGPDNIGGNFPMLSGLAIDAGKNNNRRRRGFGGGGNNADRIPAVHISRKTAARLFGDKDLLAIQKNIDSTKKAQSFAHGKTLGMTVKFSNETIMTRNVIGILPGSDPVLKNEYIVIGAHYDHVGVGGGKKDRIHNGADDNASGTSALIEIAKAFGAHKTRQARSVIFIAFSGEEKGLYGSRHYSERPVYPLDKTVAMFNLDMVGRNTPKEVTLFGAEQSKMLKRVVTAQNKASINYKLDLPAKISGNSDHASFYAKNVPVIFFTTGLHKDYHQVTDHPEKIDAVKIRDVARLCFLTATKVANSKDKPDIIKSTRPARRPTQPSKPAKPTNKKAKLY
ncbi:MAG: M20/M25/M40 family metallo-hydrolase, partial [Planctomycetota bacterium]|nr:M20/M25/M40 family metallo-hydrolase [Planctomycetota bacterium]